jgi:hypothetical protein
VRVRLLIDVETSDLPRLQRWVGEQPIVAMQFADGAEMVGRFVGAKDTVDVGAETTG